MNAEIPAEPRMVDGAGGPAWWSSHAAVEAHNARVAWIRFNLVGLVGVGVQLGALSLLLTVFHLHYVAATLLAVEAAILHNFAWHQHWTWRGRKTTSIIRRLVRFNLSTGLLSLLGNGILMPLLVQAFGLHVILANLLAIGACSIANFLMADRLVFRG